MYVFDTSPLRTLFRNYYPSRFPSLWQKFDGLMLSGIITSTREVLREVEVAPEANLRVWAEDNKEFFSMPVAKEAEFIGRIFSVEHFQHNIETKKILKGGTIADPFVIAKAACNGSTVVTLEVPKENSAKIPNICEHFSIPCLNLEEFMENENWVF